ncbi:hypothetical protein GDO81_027781 [Engystomops pustulosus]|uniref:Uncharacterized protein n=1 Tax=Engystomops pustulosus TaxID=76066 RepID=A0AAV6YPS0_ENGPU|nr:hypothetical protein GDO81_027781 [Engystomops pustulosus]
MYIGSPPLILGPGRDWQKYHSPPPPPLLGSLGVPVLGNSASLYIYIYSLLIVTIRRGSSHCCAFYIPYP